MENTISDEIEYLNLMNKLLNISTLRPDRTKTNTLSTFGERLTFDISNNKIPLLTSKYVNWKAVIIELIWFLNGDTNVKFLNDNNVKIWNDNSTREFLDKRGLYNVEEGNIGKSYGYQWRHANDIDQIKNLIDSIKTDPYGRRHILMSYNVADLSEMALPPCHIFAQFYIGIDNTISCHMYQRSVDVFLGLPFNIASYAMLTYLIGIMTGYKPSKLIISTGDTHIYANHIEQCKTQLSRINNLYEFPTITIDTDAVLSTDYLKNLSIDMFKVNNYKYHSYIKAPMAI
jgi:thymidylate synthase